jgi:glycosyltransferase involved in cell wall biosynthesis
MRVALDVRPALSRPTGVGVYIGALAASLPRLDPGSRFTLFTASLRERWSHPLAAPNVDLVDRHIPVRALNLAWNRLSWPPIEMLCGREFDLVHSPHALLTPARSAKRIISIHDLFFYKHKEMTGGEIRRDYAPLVLDHASRADGIICPSEHTAREVEQLLKVPRERICVTPYGLDEAFRREPSAGQVEGVLRDLNVPRGSILYVGSEEKRKNLEGLIRAHAALAAKGQGVPPLVLVGPDVSRSAEGKGRPRVISTGYLQTHEIRCLMSASACLVLASFEEGFGFTVVEAMAAGLPVICSRGSSLSEVAGSAAEFVEPRDTSDIVRALDLVLTNKDRAHELRSLGLEQSRRFDWNRTAEATLAFYLQVLGT